MNRQRPIKGKDWSGYDYQYGVVLSEHSVGLWNTKCKLCDDIHVMETRALRNGARSKKCKQYRAPNWSGLERWDGVIRRQYGITLDQYNDILEQQDYKCAICGNEDEVEGRRLAIDHCHSSGKVRGLLCGPCNRALGLFRDNQELLEKAKQYLDK